MTSQDDRLGRWTRAVSKAERLSARDAHVVEFIGSFRQVTTAQVQVVCFAGCRSRTPGDRALKRLTERRYLARLPRALGGTQGGSGQTVYQLGRAGHSYLERTGDCWASRVVNLHTLAITDCYASLKQAEHRGELQVLTFTTEPSCHLTVGGISLTPDARLTVVSYARGKKFHYFLEADRGMERREKIVDKMIRYWQTYHKWQSEAVFPRVLFVVPDARRVQEIERIIRAGPEAALPLFAVCTHEGFAQFVVTGPGKVANRGGNA
jgi:hypothetical protein